MTSTLSQDYNELQEATHDQNRAQLISKLYRLKDRFESKYYGNTEFRNYEKARNFTIKLSATLFQVNKTQSAIDLQVSKPLSNKMKAGHYTKKHEQAAILNPEQIKTNIKNLKKELEDLI